MKRFKLAYRELMNYLFLLKILRRETKNMSPDSAWNKSGLRKNWYGRIYTVVSLREQDMGEEEIVRHWKAMEMMRPFNDYLSSLDLYEIIYPSIEYIPDTRSYLVVYSPLFKVFSFKRFFIQIGLVIASLLALITLLNFI